MSSALALRLPDGTLCPLPTDRPLILGRAPGEGGLELDGAGVSDRHAAIARLKSGGFGLKAVDREARTRLDGRPVRQARLTPGATLELGELRLEVVERGASAPTDAAASGRAPTNPAAAPGTGEAPPSATSPSVAGSGPRTRAPEGPERVGGFRIERLIGRGSMGRVFLAVQESLQRQVALKLLRPELAADQDFVARFQAEARAAAALGHPNVVTVFDVGEADGHHYLALEYMQRGSLEDRLRSDGPLPWRAVLGVLRDAAAGLEYAEQTKLVHRDVKPANLMQTASGATKLVDLGLATSIETTSDESGVVRGTPHFMSPEQARGAPLDVRSDLFSLGSTAYRLLTGRTPFEGDSSRAILRSVVQDTPAPPSSVRADVPRELDALLARLMAKDPAERPSSAAAARAEVEELIARLGDGGTPGGAPRRRTWLLVALALVIVGGVALGLALTGGDGPPSEPDRGGRSATAGTGDRAGAGGRVGASDDSDPTGARADDPAEERDGGGPSADRERAADGSPAAGLAPTGGAADAEALLEAAEREAARALGEARLLSDPLERVDALRDVAERFQGTDAARVAATEAQAVETPEPPDPGGDPDATPTDDATLLAHLRAVTRDDDGEPLRPQAAFHALRRRVPPLGVPLDDNFERLRTAVALELERELRERYDARLDAADATLVEGRLDEAERLYRELSDDLRFLPRELEEQLANPVDEDGNPIESDLAPSELPTDRAGVLALLEEDQALEGGYTWRLADRIALVEERLAALEGGLRERYAEAMLQADRALLAERLPRREFEVALRGFRLDAAAQTLAAVRNDLRSEPYREALARQAARLRGARGAFDLLFTAWADEGWRRRTMPVPEADRDVGEARGVRADGLVLDTDDGPLQVAWTDYAADSEALEEVFVGRLERDFTAAERAAIGDLIGFAGVNETLEFVAPVLDRGRRGRLSEGEAEAVRLAFERALEFAGRPTEGGLAREAEAAEHLRTALRALEEEDWATATFAFDELLERTPTALVTLLTSDGRTRGEVVTWPPALEAPPVWEAPEDYRFRGRVPAAEPEDPAGGADVDGPDPNRPFGGGAGRVGEDDGDGR